MIIRNLPKSFLEIKFLNHLQIQQEGGEYQKRSKTINLWIYKLNQFQNKINQQLNNKQAHIYGQAIFSRLKQQLKKKVKQEILMVLILLLIYNNKSKIFMILVRNHNMKFYRKFLKRILKKPQEFTVKIILINEVDKVGYQLKKQVIKINVQFHVSIST